MLDKLKIIASYLIVIGTGAYAIAMIDSPFFYGAIAFTAIFLFSKLIEHTSSKEEVMRLYRRIAEYEKQNKALIAQLRKYDEEKADVPSIPHYFDEEDSL